MDPHEQSGTRPGTRAVATGLERKSQMQKDYGDRRLAHLEWKQACGMDDAVRQDRRGTKGAGWGGRLVGEDGFTCEELADARTGKGAPGLGSGSSWEVQDGGVQVESWEWMGG